MNNVSVDVTEDAEDHEVKEDNCRDYRDSRVFFPSVDDILQVQFDLYIPFRIQEELIGARARVGTEQFRVHMRYPELVFWPSDS